MIKGKIGKDLNIEDCYEAAKRCGLAIISQVKKACKKVACMQEGPIWYFQDYTVQEQLDYIISLYSCMSVVSIIKFSLR